MATTYISTLSLHDALPIYIKLAENYAVVGIGKAKLEDIGKGRYIGTATWGQKDGALVALEVHIFAESFRGLGERSEEHTSELQSLRHLVCRLLLEKKKNKP